MQNELILWSKKILIALLIGAIIYILYTIKSLILVIVISGFITIVINPLVDRGEQHRIPGWVTVLWVYIIIFLLGSIVIGTLIPIVINYVTDTATLVISWVNTAQKTYLSEGISGFHFHPYIEKVILLVLGKENIEHTLDIIKQNAGNIQTVITTQISSITSGWLSIVTAVWWAVANWILIAIMSFMMVLERKAIGGFILSFTPREIDTYLHNHYHQIQHVTTAWMRAMLILSLSIFAITYIGLFTLEVIFGFDTERTFTLAVIWGIMEFIPYIWPIIALIPALIIGLGISWKVALIITLLYIAIQQIENNFLVPKVMSKSLDLSPVLVFIMMLAWGLIGGILGIILAIPIAWVARIFYMSYRNRQDVDHPVTDAQTWGQEKSSQRRSPSTDREWKKKIIWQIEI